jgi:hypothetical protein
MAMKTARRVTSCEEGDELWGGWGYDNADSEGEGFSNGQGREGGLSGMGQVQETAGVGGNRAGRLESVYGPGAPGFSCAGVGGAGSVPGREGPDLYYGPGGRAANGGPVNTQGAAPAPRHRRRLRVQRSRPELSEGSSEEFLELSSESSDDVQDVDANGVPIPVVEEGVRWDFRDETWNTCGFEYEPQPRPFLGTRGPIEYNHRLPTSMQLFNLFWPWTILRDIVNETNRYARQDDGAGGTMEGRRWEQLTMAGLKAFMAIHIYIGLKKQPNLKTYWMHDSIFHCDTISNIFTRQRFQDLRRCLHITNPAQYENVQRDDPAYDKIHQTRWLVDAIRERCKAAWNLGKKLTIDEMMVRYKGTYSPIRQYMPNKPLKWGLKVWCLACSVSKYVWNFYFYCGKSQAVNPPLIPIVPDPPIVMPGEPTVDPPLATMKPQPVQPPRARRGEAKLAHEVVLNMVSGFEGRGHLLVMDNYFSSIGLFQELLAKGIYATGTMRTNRIGLPADLKDTKSFKRSSQGTTEWRMHSSRSISCVMWKDKRPVLLNSTHARPIQPPCERLIITVPRRNGSVRENIQTSPILLEYTTDMRGVDVADQLRASYSCQVWSHKWWHRIFFFLLDMTIVNMYIVYLAHVTYSRSPRTPMIHLQFKVGLCEALLDGWQMRNELLEEDGELPNYCMPTYSCLRKPCVVCEVYSPHFFCHACGDKWMCHRKGCYKTWHDALYRCRNGRNR